MQQRGAARRTGHGWRGRARERCPGQFFEWNRGTRPVRCAPACENPDTDGVRHQRSRHRPCAARGRARAGCGARTRCTGTRRTASRCFPPMPTCAPRRSSPSCSLRQPKGPWHVFDMHFSMQALDRPEHRRQRGIASKGFTPRMVRRLRGRVRDDPRLHRRGRRTGPLRVRERARGAGAAAPDRRHARTPGGALRAVPALERRGSIGDRAPRRHTGLRW